MHNTIDYGLVEEKYCYSEEESKKGLSFFPTLFLFETALIKDMKMLAKEQST